MTINLALTTLLTGAVILGQGAPAKDSTGGLKESLAENQAKLRAYSWVETTQVTLKGEVKKQEQKQCYYGADGKVQKTAVAGAPAAQPKEATGGKRGGGKLKERVVENKVDEMKDYMEKVVALVHEYVPPDAQKIGAAESAGNLSKSGATLNVKNYLKPGDLVAIGFDPAAKLLTSYTVQAYVEKPKEDDVKLAVTFGKLEDGTSYPQQIVLDVTAKKMQVKVTNSGYKKTGS